MGTHGSVTISNTLIEISKFIRHETFVIISMVILFKITAFFESMISGYESQSTIKHGRFRL